MSHSCCVTYLRVRSAWFRGCALDASDIKVVEMSRPDAQAAAKKIYDQQVRSGNIQTCTRYRVSGTYDDTRYTTAASIVVPRVIRCLCSQATIPDTML